MKEKFIRFTLTFYGKDFESLRAYIENVLLSSCRDYNMKLYILIEPPKTYKHFDPLNPIGKEQMKWEHVTVYNLETVIESAENVTLQKHDELLKFITDTHFLLKKEFYGINSDIELNLTMSIWER